MSKNIQVLQSYREQDVTLNENAPTKVDFLDTEPNHIVITNNTSNPIYVGQSANVSQNLFELQVPSGGTKIYAKPKTMREVYFWHASTSAETIHIVSFVDSFGPSSINQTQETVNTQQVTGTVAVSSLPATPAGNNTIGLVKLTDGTEQASFTAAGEIKAAITESLPAGTNHIGEIAVNQLPNVEDIGYTPVTVTATAAGDITVKAAGGKVVGIRGVGTINLLLKDGTSQIWDTIAGGTDFFPRYPIQCQTSIVLNFSAAGTAYILYK